MTDYDFCEFCGNRMWRKKYETYDAFARRTYCQQPKCQTKGREAELREAYAKKQDLPAEGLSQARVTRAIHLLRWGKEVMESIDLYGREASADWERTYKLVQENKAMQINAVFTVMDANGDVVGKFETTDRILLNEPVDGPQASSMIDRLVDGYNFGIVNFMAGTERDPDES